MRQLSYVVRRTQDQLTVSILYTYIVFDSRVLNSGFLDENLRIFAILLILHNRIAAAPTTRRSRPYKSLSR